MTAASELAVTSAPARPAERAWCVVCRSFRPYRNTQVLPPSRFHAEGFDTDILVCTGCATSLLIVRAPCEETR